MAKVGEMGDPMATPVSWWYTVLLKIKKLFFRTSVRRRLVVLVGRGTKLAYTIRASNPSSMGIDVYSDLTSMVIRVVLDGRGGNLESSFNRC